MRISIVTIVLVSALIVSISDGQDTTPPATGIPAAPGVAPGGGAVIPPPAVGGPTAPLTGTGKPKVKSQATYPKPLEVPAKWQLDIKTQIPRPISVRMPGGNTRRTFWYVLYTVTNRTKDSDSGRPTEQLFAPNFFLYTKTGQLLRGGAKVPTLVYEAIKDHPAKHVRVCVTRWHWRLFHLTHANPGIGAVCSCERSFYRLAADGRSVDVER